MKVKAAWPSGYDAARAKAESESRYRGAGGSTPEWFIASMLDGWKSATGLSVSPESALGVTAVYAAHRVISETLGSLPIGVYRRRENGAKQSEDGHSAYRLLHDEANPEMSAMVLRESLMAHILGWGNAYAEIEWDRGGRPKALWPLAPDRTQARRNAAGRIYYEVRTAAGQAVSLFPENVLHVPGLAFDGLSGRSPLRVAREAVGLALAAEQCAGRLFSQGLQASGVLQHPGELGAEAQENLRKSMQNQAGGIENWGRLLILEEGMIFNPLTIKPEEAQFIEARKFQVAEIARIYRIPPHLLGDLEKATFSNIEQQVIDFVVHCIRPWAVRWEQELNRKLFQPGDGLFVEHNLEGLLRGDLASRYGAYAIGRNWGWLSTNDVRRRENMDPTDFGDDDYLRPLNMAQAGSPFTPPPAPGAPGAAPAPEVIRAHRAALLGPCGRIVRRHVGTLRRIVSKPDQSWSEAHAEIDRELAGPLATMLEGPVLALAVTLGGSAQAALVPAFLGRIAADYFAEVRTRLADAPEPDDDVTLDAWERDGSAWLADAILIGQAAPSAKEETLALRE